jgi:hypothetical protein
LLLIALFRWSLFDLADPPRRSATVAIPRVASSRRSTCFEDSRYFGSDRWGLVSPRINGYLALRFPVLSVAAWWMSRHMSVAGTAASARPASSADALAATRRRFGN